MHRKHPAEKLEKIAIKLILTIVFIVMLCIAHGKIYVGERIGTGVSADVVTPATYFMDVFWLLLYIAIGVIAFIFIDPEWFTPNKKP